MDDFAIVGGGIGGACTALFLSSRFQTTLYEKESYLGGCSSTFLHKKHFYNTGATTFTGYQENSYIHTLFEKYHIDFKKKFLKNALTVRIGNKTIHRYNDLEYFIEEINHAFFHAKNREFYTLIKKISHDFLAIQDYTYSNASLFSKLRSLSSFKTVLSVFYPYLFVSAETFIEKYFGTLDSSYKDYLDNQVLIVAQARLKDINFLTAALALAYQFMDNYYIFGGMGSIFESISKELPHVQTNTFITQIHRDKNHYHCESNKGSFISKQIVLNTSLFEASSLFVDKEIQNYLSRYQKLDTGISAFMLYLQIDSPQSFEHHYQIILKERIKYTISNSIFVSFADSDDTKMAQSVTVSVHTQNNLWQKESLLEQKMELEAIIKMILCEHLGLKMHEIKHAFSATPFTFKRFINRKSLGGIPMLKSNLPYMLPSNDSPIKGLYHVGDTTFAAQGWPGVLQGVQNLERLLCPQ